VAFSSAVGAAGIATVLGSLAGYYRGAIDQVVGRLIELMLAFPAILLGMLLIAALGPSLPNLLVVIVLVRIPGEARIIRSLVLSLRERSFVEVSRSVGASDWRIIFRHILPNTYGTIAVLTMLGMASGVFLEAAFGFLGLGTQPPDPSWGTMMLEGLDYLGPAPHVVFFTGLAMFVVTLAFNLMGDALRDAFDPSKSSQRRRN
jgi:peptide/nickel transport system permease protein